MAPTRSAATRAVRLLAAATVLAVPRGEAPARGGGAPSPPGSVEGSVLDARSGAPLAGAEVTLVPRPAGLVSGGGAGASAFPARDRTVRSDREGRYRFDGVAEGAYSLRVVRAGYRPATVEVVLAAGPRGGVPGGLRVEPVRLTPAGVRRGPGGAGGRRRSVDGRCPVDGSGVVF